MRHGKARRQTQAGGVTMVGEAAAHIVHRMIVWCRVVLAMRDVSIHINTALYDMHLRFSTTMSYNKRNEMSNHRAMTHIESPRADVNISLKSLEIADGASYAIGFYTPIPFQDPPVACYTRPSHLETD